MTMYLCVNYRTGVTLTFGQVATFDIVRATQRRTVEGRLDVRLSDRGARKLAAAVALSLNDVRHRMVRACVGRVVGVEVLSLPDNPVSLWPAARKKVLVELWIDGVDVAVVFKTPASCGWLDAEVRSMQGEAWPRFTALRGYGELIGREGDTSPVVFALRDSVPARLVDMLRHLTGDNARANRDLIFRGIPGDSRHVDDFMFSTWCANFARRVQVTRRRRVDDMDNTEGAAPVRRRRRRRRGPRHMRIEGADHVHPPRQAAPDLVHGNDPLAGVVPLPLTVAPITFPPNGYIGGLDFGLGTVTGTTGTTTTFAFGAGQHNATGTAAFRRNLVLPPVGVAQAADEQDHQDMGRIIDVLTNNPRQAEADHVGAQANDDHTDDPRREDVGPEVGGAGPGDDVATP